MFFTVTSELGNFSAKLYSEPSGWNKVDNDPPKLEPDSNSASFCQHSA